MAAATLDAIRAHIEATAGAGQKAVNVGAYAGGFGANGLSADFREVWGSWDSVNGGTFVVYTAQGIQYVQVAAGDGALEKDADGTLGFTFSGQGVTGVVEQNAAGVVSVGVEGALGDLDMAVAAPGSSLSVSGV